MSSIQEAVEQQQPTDVKESKRKPTEADVNEVIDWLKSEFANVDKNALDTKANKVNEAAAKLEEKGFTGKRKQRIAQELAHNAKQLGVSKGWIYEVLKEEYKNPARAEAMREAAATRNNSSGGSQSTVLTSKGGSGGSGGGSSSGGGRQLSMDHFVQLINEAKDGHCRDCQCPNCQTLRLMPAA